MGFKEWSRAIFIECLEEGGKYEVSVRRKGVTTLKQIVEKKTSTEENSYNRLKKIIETLYDISPSVKEIGIVEYIDGKVYSIQTGFGERWVIVDNSLKHIRFYDVKPTCERREHTIMMGYYWSIEEDYLYKISLETHPSKHISLSPQLTSEAPMTEEEIYNSLIEIEDILKKYDFARASEEHKANVDKFISRFGEEDETT